MNNIFLSTNIPAGWNGGGLTCDELQLRPSELASYTCTCRLRTHTLVAVSSVWPHALVAEDLILK
jgi:hypothetical protein